MNWEQTSVSKEEYYKMLSAIQIKNDCETLKALTPIISQPIISLGMLPYLSLFCSSVEEYINSNISTIAIKNDSPFEISDMRSKLKLFNEKSQKQIILSDDLQDQEFRGRPRFPCTRGQDVHYNLGIFCDEEGHIIGNTQYIFYLFQDKSFSKSLQNPEEIRAYGQVMGKVINSVCTGFRDFLPNYSVGTNCRTFKIKYKDFNTNCMFSLFPKIKNGKVVTLRLLHSLTFINFLRYVIMNATNQSNTWQLRVAYVTLYYAVNSIDKLAHSLDINNSEEKKLSIMLNNCISFGDGLFDSEFRSCMMHYGFYNNGNCAIDDKHLDVQTPFYGLIESRFNGYNFTEYTSLLKNVVLKLSDALTTMLPFNLTGLSEL